MITLQDLKSLTRKELLQELVKARKELVHLRISVRTKNQKDTSLVRDTKQTIARIKTQLKEMDLEEMIQKAPSIQ